MKDAEIKDAIETNPGGSDLEIALAITTDEASVRRVRAVMVKEIEEAKERGRASREARQLAEREAAAKEAASAAKKKLLKEAKAIPEMDAPEIAVPADHKEEKPQVPKQRYFIRDPDSGSVKEMARMNDSRTVIIFELAEV